MTFGLLGGVVVATGVFALLLERKWFLIVLAVSTALPTTAALTISGSSVPPFYILGGIATVLALAGLHSGKSLPAGSQWLFMFAAVAIGVTIAGPTLFQQIRVLIPREGIDVQVVRPGYLNYNISMLAQVGYMLLGIGIALYVAQRHSGDGLLNLAFVAGIGTSTLRLVVEGLGGTWPEDLFRDYASTAFNQYEQRFVGIFSEPSYLAVMGIAAVAYYLARLRERRGIPWSASMLSLSLVNLWAAESGTAILALLVVGSAFATYYYSGWLFAGRRIAPFAPLLPLLIVAALLAKASFVREAWTLLLEKSVSESAENRFAADLFSIRLFVDTKGIGVGLGANRPSSFLTMLLSCVGAVGFLLFVIAVGVIVWQAWGRSSQPTLWALAGLLIAKSIAEPALSTPLLWLTLGVLLAGPQRVPSVDHDLGSGEALSCVVEDEATRPWSRVAETQPARLRLAGRLRRWVPDRYGAAATLLPPTPPPTAQV